jgi:hypothetical protein
MRHRTNKTYDGAKATLNARSRAGSGHRAVCTAIVRHAHTIGSAEAPHTIVSMTTMAATVQAIRQPMPQRTARFYV